MEKKKLGPLSLSSQNGIFQIEMHNGENRVNPEFVRNFHLALDTVEKAAVNGNVALVTTGSDKFYSNGLDLNWMTENPQEGNKFLAEFARLLGRLLSFPAPTIAALNGHAYAGGFMLALAHDFRIMRTDRGFVCLPEVDLKLAFEPGMNALIAAKVSDATLFRDMMLTAAKFTATEAAQRKLIDVACAAADVLPKSKELASKVAGKASPVYGAIKAEMYRNAMSLLIPERAGQKLKAKL